MAKIVHVKEKKPWQRVSIPKNPFDSSIFDGLLDVQELTDYELVKKNVSLKGKKRKSAQELESSNPKISKKETLTTEKEQNLKETNKKSTKNKKDLKCSTVENSQNDAELLKKKKGKSRKKKTATGNAVAEDNQTIENNNLMKKKGKSRKKKNQIEATADSLVNKCDLSEGNDNQNINKDNLEKEVAGKFVDVSKLNHVSNSVTTEQVKKKKGKSRKKKLVSDQQKTIVEDSVNSAVNCGGDSKEKDASAKKGKKGKRQKSNDDERNADSESIKNVKQSNSKLDMSEWDNLFVPPVLLKSLQEQGFQKPTTIQTLTLPSAIRDHKDILAAAETGSGKTLAFGIPVVKKVLSYQEIQSEKSEDFNSAIEVNDDVEMDVCVQNEDDEEEEDELEVDSDKSEDSNESDEDGTAEDKDNEEDESHPLALILEPTRELAVQVHKHLTNLAKHTNVKFAIVVGGMAIEKQRRLLKRKPEIIIATPGRLWQLIQEGDDHLSGIDLIQSLVVDEADRMVEKGHYEELTKLLEMINKSPRRNVKRQSFVMSATLTMEMTIPWRLNNKKKQKDLDKDKLKMLTTRICVGIKPKVIDLTPKDRVAQSLTEMRINCSAKEKDYYLYYFLCQHPGRTLVFANSKDCLRRLVSVFTLLECSPYPLHADMQQRQRLKNLDRFAANSQGLLLASDVAARGLDIPNVDYVIHYQVPQTKENYVHRSGRTARASNVGLSVMLVAPEDAKNYRKIVYGVKNGEDLPLLPYELDLMPTVKARVELARTVDVAEYRSKKVRLHNDFFSKAAEEMDMILDDNVLVPGQDEDDGISQADEKNAVKQMKYELSSMLKGTLAPLRMTKYPTKSGQLLSMKSTNLLTLTSA